MRFRALYGLASLATLVACTAPRPNLKPAPTSSEHSGSETGDGFALILHNRNFLDVNVFVQHDGQATRVGTVTGSSSLSLAVPRWMLGNDGLVRLIAEPIGDNSSYTTDNLLIQPGQIVELNVESAIARSHYSVQ